MFSLTLKPSTDTHSEPNQLLCGKSSSQFMSLKVLLNDRLDLKSLEDKSFTEKPKARFHWLLMITIDYNKPGDGKQLLSSETSGKNEGFSWCRVLRWGEPSPHEAWPTWPHGQCMALRISSPPELLKQSENIDSEIRKDKKLVWEITWK